MTVGEFSKSKVADELERLSMTDILDYKTPRHPSVWFELLVGDAILAYLLQAWDSECELPDGFQNLSAQQIHDGMLRFAHEDECPAEVLCDGDALYNALSRAMKFITDNKED